MQSSDRMKIKLPNGSGKSKRVAVFCPPAEEPEAGLRDPACISTCSTKLQVQQPWPMSVASPEGNAWTGIGDGRYDRWQGKLVLLRLSQHMDCCEGL